MAWNPADDEEWDHAFLGTEARAAGTVNRYQLAMQYDSIFRNVYVPKGYTRTAKRKAHAAWLWSGRRATVAGLSAAALHRSRYIDANLPAELNQPSRHKTKGIVLHSDELFDDEVCSLRGVPLTTPARTAFDLGRRNGLTTAVIRLDALLRATEISAADVVPIIERHQGARGLVTLRRAMALADGGAESPQETRTRLLLVRSGLPPLRTQIEVFDGRYLVGRVDMGWEKWKVGVEYDGAQHWEDPDQRTRDIDRAVDLEDLRWRIVRVGWDLLKNRPNTIVSRARSALRAAGCPL